MELAAGTRVTDTIELSRLLGEGGMGAVWVARHHGLGIDVAVKFLNLRTDGDPAMVTRFTREARAAAQVKSPYVVQVFDHGVSHGRPYIVMELLDGEELAEHIRRRGALPGSEVATILRQVGKALERAHRLGIVHRDIKPSNVFLVDPDGDCFVKLLDFGIAKHTEQEELNVTASGVVMGTAYYMSPEQVVESRHVDARADLWSLAVLAYEAMTGRLPFEGNTVGAVLVAIDRGTFLPPHAGWGIGSPALDHWFARALARDPGRRFADIATLVDEFDRAVQTVDAPSTSVAPATSTRSQDGTAPAATLTQAVPIVSSRRPVWIALGVASALGALALGLLRWTSGDPPAEVLENGASTDPSAAMAAAASPAPARTETTSSGTIDAGRGEPGPAVEPVTSSPTAAEGPDRAGTNHRHRPRKPLSETPAPRPRPVVRPPPVNDGPSVDDKKPPPKDYGF